MSISVHKRRRKSEPLDLPFARVSTAEEERGLEKIGAWTVTVHSRRWTQGIIDACVPFLRKSDQKFAHLRRIKRKALGPRSDAAVESGESDKHIGKGDGRCGNECDNTDVQKDGNADAQDGGTRSEDNVHLEILICELDVVAREDIEQHIIETVAGITNNDFTLNRRELPLYPARNERQYLEWREIWPISYFQPSLTPDIFATSDIQRLESAVEALKDAVTVANKHGDLPIAAALLIPGSLEVKVVCADSRVTTGNPIRHAVCECVRKVALLERQRRQRKLNVIQNRHCNDELYKPDTSDKSSNTSNDTEVKTVQKVIGGNPDIGNGRTDLLSSSSQKQISSPSYESEDAGADQYLCTGMIAITTHEPCTMCAMALVHSRVGGLIFIKSMQKSGAIRSNFGIHWQKELNHRFTAYGPWQSCSLNEEIDSFESENCDLSRIHA